jgi:two-component system, chemotaxis family, protein-glutamate methylesterase/glutaminase
MHQATENTTEAKKRFKTSKDKDMKATHPAHPSPPYSKYEIIAIGVSVGGPMVMKTILSKLPAHFPLPIVVVQHMSLGFITGYAAWLNSYTQLKVKEAEQLELLEKGTVYFAPDNCHFKIQRLNGKLHAKLIKGHPVDGFYPSITVLLNSIAKTCGKNAIGILLTGMGSDGAQGLLAIKNTHGHTVIQDPKSAVVFGMASIAQSLGAVDRVIELDNIASYLTKLVKF